jgi:hypothetical protein
MAARILLPSPDEMTPEQRRVHDAIVAGPRGTVVGPLRAVIHNPQLAERWSALGEVLRFGTSLPKRPERARHHRHRPALDQPDRVVGSRPRGRRGGAAGRRDRGHAGRRVARVRRT